MTATLSHADLDLTLAPAGDSYQLTLRLTQPDDRADHRAGPFPVVLDTKALLALTTDPTAYGAALSAALFADPGAMTAFAEMRAAALSANRGLRVRLSLPPTLHALRWETLADPRSGRALAVDDALLLSRYLAAEDFQPVLLRPKGALRAVVAVAAPTDARDYGLAPIDTEAETGRVRAALGSVTTTVINATWEALGEALRAGCDILYLVAHGALQGGQPWLYLVDDQGNADRRRGGALADLVRSLDERKPRLVVLASCEGAGGGYTDTLAALGPLLTQAGVPAVLAMQGKLSLTTNARLVPVLFHELLVDGMIDRAVNAARLVVADDRPDWWLPVLYTRLRDGQLWTINAAADQDTVKGTKGTVDVSGTANAAIGVNQGTVQLFFGGQPGEGGAALLAAYLDSLAEDCQRLRLHRLTGKRQSGSEQRSQADGLRLQDVYTSLTTDGPPRRRFEGRFPAARVRRFLQRLEQIDRTADAVAPERVLEPTIIGAGRDALHSQAERHIGIADLPDATPLHLHLVRPELALEAIFAERRLVLLGEPGAGKSTALRYLALLLARRLRGESLRIPGWHDGETPVPVVVPLGRVAAALRAGAADAYAALLQVVGDVLEAGVRVGLRRFLTPALRNGGLLLLCDGLDELPAAAADGGRAPRADVAAALRRLASETKARMVVTSRVLPYRAPGDWKLLPEDGWALRTVQPLAFGQTRVFVRSWYAALALSDPDLAGGGAAARAADLIAELERTERLRPLVRSPLLLTMLSILHYNTGDVPRDRAKLYEECVLLLLDRWEPERQPGIPRASLIERLGLPSLDPLRQVLHELAYQAHLQPAGDDGRGLIGLEPLTIRMFTFFKRLGSLAEAEVKVGLFLTMLDDEDSGLLQRRGDEGYALPHLTFQEYLAACHLADHPKMAEEAYQRWCGADRERWREALLLLMGRLHQQGKAEEKGLPWLKLLAGTKVGRAPKEPGQRRQDALLAALSYAELRERGAFAGSLLDIEAELEAPLGTAVCALLAAPDSAISTADRVTAARVLGEIGDPRYPLRIEDWQGELERRSTDFGQPTGYWCYVREGPYQIGGWEGGKPSAKVQLPAFWLARYPITVAQYAPFVAEGYGPQAERWWTPEGWKWKQARKRTQPWRWDDPTFNGANQPVIGVTWYEATAYCAWLTERLRDILPEGYEVCLPTEAEWEAAAAYDAHMQRQRYPWGDDQEPSPDLAIYDASGLGRPAPVGCCPAGAAACGTLDIVGNVWEWTASSYKGYPAKADVVTKDFTPNQGDMPVRGGSWRQNSSYVRCGARGWDLPDVGYLDYVRGLRVCVSPRSHKDSVS